MYLCEFEGCQRVATSEYIRIARDEDGQPEVYYTYRCRKHPQRDTRYARKLVATV